MEMEMGNLLRCSYAWKVVSNAGIYPDTRLCVRGKGIGDNTVILHDIPMSIRVRLSPEDSSHHNPGEYGEPLSYLVLILASTYMEEEYY